MLPCLATSDLTVSIKHCLQCFKSMSRTLVQTIQLWGIWDSRRGRAEKGRSNLSTREEDLESLRVQKALRRGSGTLGPHRGSCHQGSCRAQLRRLGQEGPGLTVYSFPGATSVCSEKEELQLAPRIGRQMHMSSVGCHQPGIKASRFSSPSDLGLG